MAGFGLNYVCQDAFAGLTNLKDAADFGSADAIGHTYECRSQALGENEKGHLEAPHHLRFEPGGREIRRSWLRD